MPRTAGVYEVNISARSVAPFAALLGDERVASIERLAARMRELVGATAIWNVNSTAVGGGVSEMLRSLLRYARGLGIQVRWVVLDGDPAFFRLTKRLHNALHDSPGDGSALGPDEAALYERTLEDNAIAFDALAREGDVVICHDPQTAGLVPHLLKKGLRVVWRCHIGHDHSGVEVDRGWAFLRKYIEEVPFAIFSRGAYAPSWLPGKRAVVLPPNIDPFSAKNQDLDEATMRAILSEVGLVDAAADGAPVFTRDDGSIGRVDRKVEVLRLGRAPDWSVPLVVQVSRWDRMKDPVGVLTGFARYIAPEAPGGAQLVLAGPDTASVADDPEGAEVLREVEAAWRALPDATRAAAHLAQLPMADPEENGAIVNALQRHAAVVLQKSLGEGFGLTVTEAMWKRRPVVASAVGGIRDQIEDGREGLLLEDPSDLRELGRAVNRVLADPELAARLGEAAHERVRQDYLSITSLERWARLVEQLFTS